MKKNQLIGLGTFIGLTIVWYFLLANSHMLGIFPCYGGDSSTCELIEVTRQARTSGSQLTTIGYILAFIVVVGIPASIGGFVSKKMNK